MNPDDIFIRNTSSLFQYEKMAREIDQCDDIEVDCETWGDPVAKEEAVEIESQLDFLSHFDS